MQWSMQWRFNTWNPRIVLLFSNVENLLHACAMTESVIMPSSLPFSHPCQPTCPPSSPPFLQPPCAPRPLDIRILISICTTVPVLILIIFVLSTAICCWFFHRNQRRRDLRGKGGVIVLGDDLQRANQEGRLLVNVALVNVRVYM